MAVAGQQTEKLSPAEFQQLQDLAACEYLVILIIILDKDKDNDNDNDNDNKKTTTKV